MITPIIHRLEEVGSTNDAALDMARKGAPEGTVVTARSQTKGRGRRGREWFAKPGDSLLMSIVLRPSIPFARYPELAFIAAIAVAECLSECGIQSSLKWPNDVLVDDKKIAGILVEADKGAAILGIGVNVRQTEFPVGLGSQATSIAIAGGSCASVDALMESLLTHLFEAYEAPFEDILARWRKYMWGLGRSVDVSAEGGIVTGVMAGVDFDGALLVDTNGETQRIHAAEAIRLRAQS